MRKGDVNVHSLRIIRRALAGQPVVFKCKVHEVKEEELPEVNDEFVKDISEFDTLDEYKPTLGKP